MITVNLDMHQTNQLRKHIFVFLLSFSVLIGSSYNTYLSFERFQNPDSETYMNIARLNFQDQSLVRKYRIIVPLLASATAWPIEKVYYKVFTANRDNHDWPLLTGFFLVNTLLMSLAAVFIFAIMQQQNLGATACGVGLAAFLAGGRWASFLTGHPVTDSLTILCIAMVVYGLIRPNYILLCIGIVFGFLSKESTALFFPMIILFMARNKLAAIACMLFALLLYFAIKYIIDQQSGTGVSESLQRDLEHLSYVTHSLSKLFSLKGIGDLFSVYGFFTLPLLTGIFYKSFRKGLWQYFDKLLLVFCLTIFVHMILSAELARMLYLGSAMFIPFIAKSFDVHPAFNKFNLKHG